MKAYRQDAHVVPLAIWAGASAGLAGYLLYESRVAAGLASRSWSLAAGVGLLALSPLAFFTYFLRARLVWLAVDPARGILVRGTHLVAWEEIVRVERRRPCFRRTTGPARMRAVDVRKWSERVGCGDVFGCLVASFFLMALVILAAGVLLAYWITLYVVIPLLVVPLLEVFAPFGDRVKIVCRDRSLNFRDLREGDEFLRLVSSHRPVLEV